MEKMGEMAAKSWAIFFCWAARSVDASGGRRDCREGCQLKGMLELISSTVGRMASHCVETPERRREMARRPLTLSVKGDLSNAV